MSITSLIRSSFSAFTLGTGSAKSADDGDTPPVLDFPEAPSDVRQLIRDRRYLQILAPSDGLEFDAKSIDFAWRATEQDMAYIPPGHVTLINEQAIADNVGLTLIQGSVGTSEVAAFYLDRTPVTNLDYQRFVEAGGYDDYKLWPEHILETILQFVDSTGQVGPAHWVNGKPLDGTLAHPVVGVSWYEANAYAQWAGKRLPTAAEWQRAGTWGKSPGDSVGEVRYPWGNSFDPENANTWAAGLRQTASVTQFSGGSTPNGVHQLIGNVWEWMNTQYVLHAGDGINVHLSEPMAEIRGGAFDTYFHSQATCQSRSGQSLAGRHHNIGFRCCRAADDLARNSNEDTQANTDPKQDAQ